MGDKPTMVRVDGVLMTQADADALKVKQSAVATPNNVNQSNLKASYYNQPGFYTQGTIPAGQNFVQPVAAHPVATHQVPVGYQNSGYTVPTHPPYMNPPFGVAPNMVGGHPPHPGYHMSGGVQPGYNVSGGVQPGYNVSGGVQPMHNVQPAGAHGFVAGQEPIAAPNFNTAPKVTETDNFIKEPTLEQTAVLKKQAILNQAPKIEPSNIDPTMYSLAPNFDNAQARSLPEEFLPKSYSNKMTETQMKIMKVPIIFKKTELKITRIVINDLGQVKSGEKEEKEQETLAYLLSNRADEMIKPIPRTSLHLIYSIFRILVTLHVLVYLIVCASKYFKRHEYSIIYHNLEAYAVNSNLADTFSDFGSCSPLKDVDFVELTNSSTQKWVTAYFIIYYIYKVIYLLLNLNFFFRILTRGFLIKSQTFNTLYNDYFGLMMDYSFAYALMPLTSIDYKDCLDIKYHIFGMNPFTIYVFCCIFFIVNVIVCGYVYFKSRGKALSAFINYPICILFLVPGFIYSMLIQQNIISAPTTVYNSVKIFNNKQTYKKNTNDNLFLLVVAVIGLVLAIYYVMTTIASLGLIFAYAAPAMIAFYMETIVLTALTWYLFRGGYDYRQQLLVYYRLASGIQEDQNTYFFDQQLNEDVKKSKDSKYFNEVTYEAKCCFTFHGFWYHRSLKEMFTTIFKGEKVFGDAVLEYQKRIHGSSAGKYAEKGEEKAKQAQS